MIDIDDAATLQQRMNGTELHIFISSKRNNHDISQLQDFIFKPDSNFKIEALMTIVFWYVVYACLCSQQK